MEMDSQPPLTGSLWKRTRTLSFFLTPLSHSWCARPAVAAPAATDCLLRRWLPDFQLGYPGVHITPRLLLIKFNSVYQLQKVYRWRLLECLLA